MSRAPGSDRAERPFLGAATTASGTVAAPSGAGDFLLALLGALTGGRSVEREGLLVPQEFRGEVGSTSGWVAEGVGEPREAGGEGIAREPRMDSTRAWSRLSNLELRTEMGRALPPPVEQGTGPGPQEDPGSASVPVMRQEAAPEDPAKQGRERVSVGHPETAEGSLPVVPGGPWLPAGDGIPLPGPIPPASDPPHELIERLRELEGVHPELVRRVERVVERMWQEFGHRVEVVEGWRSQERQESLYAQGRTTPGPMVTWTRDSAHTRGEALDVRIDGGWEDVRAFERLQTVAQSEGLRTLGMRDPGHLELPEGASGRPRAGVLPLAEGRTPPNAREALEGNRRAGVGDVLPASRDGVARVAEVADVARVAQTSVGPSRGRAPGSADHRGPNTLEDRPGVESADRSVARNPSRMALPDPLELPTRRAPEWARIPGTEELEASGGPLPRGSGEESPSGSAAGLTESTRFPFVSSSEFPAATGVRPAGDGDRTIGSTTLLRTERVRALLQEAARPGGAFRVGLTDVDGMGTDLHLRVRGRGVQADIEARDPARAQSLRARLAELRSGLLDRGLEPERLAVRWTPAEASAVREPIRVPSVAAEQGAGFRADREGGSREESDGGRHRESPGDSEAPGFFGRNEDDQ